MQGDRMSIKNHEMGKRHVEAIQAFKTEQRQAKQVHLVCFTLASEAMNHLGISFMNGFASTNTHSSLGFLEHVPTIGFAVFHIFVIARALSLSLCLFFFFCTN
jgi:hypothetical protein